MTMADFHTNFMFQTAIVNSDRLYRLLRLAVDGDIRLTSVRLEEVAHEVRVSFEYVTSEGKKWKWLLEQ